MNSEKKSSSLKIWTLLMAATKGMLIEVRKQPVRLVNNSMKIISKMLLFFSL